MVRFPELFRHPGAADVVADEGLIGHRPASLASLHEVDDPGEISAVAVVVAGKQVAVVVEGKFLGIANSGGEDLEIRAIRVHPEDRTASAAHHIGQNATVWQRDAVAAVAHRVVELPIRAPDEAVKIVTLERGLDAVAGRERLFGVGNAIAVAVVEAIDAGDLGHPDRTVLGEDAGRDPVHGIVELGDHATAVGGAIANKVALKLSELSRSHQTICITHLPQIAASAHTHFHVAKSSHKGRTTTSVYAVEDELRVEEVARLLDGSLSEVSLAHAKSLLEKQSA